MNSPIVSAIKRRIALNAGIVVVVIIDLTGITLIATGQVIGRPVSRLKAAIDALHADGRRVEVDWESNDELGDVVRAFNAMQKSQTAAEAEIRRNQAELEDRVAARTAELGESRRILEAVIENSDAMVCVKDPEGRYLLVNRKWEEMATSKREDSIGKTDHDIFPQKNADEYRANDRQAMDTHALVSAEESIIVDGETRTLMVQKYPLLGPGGELEGLCGVFHDITERKAQEQEIREQHRFITLLHSISDATNAAETSEDAIQVCLDEICAFTGWPVGHAYFHDSKMDIELAPSKIWHLTEPEKFASFRKVTEAKGFRRGEGLPGRVLETGESAWFIDVTKDANFPRAKQAIDIGVRAGFAFPATVGSRVLTVLEFFAEGAAVPDQRTLDAMANVGQQLGGVIERKRANERVRKILEDSPIAISISLDDDSAEDGVIQFANSRFFELMGFAAEDVDTATTSQFMDKSVQREDFETSLAAGDTLRNTEVTVRKKGGEELWALMSISPITYDDRQSALIWLFDITERKLAEARLQDAYDIITGSIEYATHIQRSVLPADKDFSDIFSDHFVLWQPRDGVGGDIYWNRVWGKGRLVILADCTGHGVPGAFMTLIATGALDRAQEDVDAGDVAGLVQRMHQLIQQFLGQHAEEGTIDDGLDLGACYLDDTLDTM